MTSDPFDTENEAAIQILRNLFMVILLTIHIPIYNNHIFITLKYILYNIDMVKKQINS